MQEYSWEIRLQAEELYIVDGLTFEQVSERVGVSVSQLKRWSGDAEQSWPDRKREYREALSSIRRDTVLAKAKLIKSVIREEDPQKAYAFASLQAATAKAAQVDMPQPAKTSGPLRIIKTAQDAVDALQEAIEKKLNSMLTNPGELSLTKIKEVNQAMEMIEHLKAKYKPDDGKPTQKGGLTDIAADAIRKQILGLS